jgi:predicted extracellular nuclease
MKKIYSLLIVALCASNFSNAQVVISQVYGGGGNGSSVYNNDFIELYNRGTAAVSINGWSVQYTSAAGSTWSSTNLPNVTIQPGKYYLIQEASGANTPGALPTPDLNGITCGCTFQSNGSALPTGLALSGTAGKVILVSSTTQETTVNPTGTQIIDKVGFGPTATGFEGSAPTAILSNSTGAMRNNNGCTDTNDNAADFTVGTPVARNSATATNTCSLGVNQNSISGLNVYPNPVTNGTFNITTDANAEKNVVVYDVLGKQVLKVTTSNSAINVANLNAGVYIVKVTEEGKTATRKLVIR